MARIRSIKPEFPQSESMGRVSRDARLLFIQMWTLADDSGRLRGNSRMLASLLFPYDDDAPGAICEWMAELEREKCIVAYVGSDGSSYVQICKWKDHQKIDKPSESKIPPPDSANPREPSANPREPSRPSRARADQGSRIKERIKDQGEDQGSRRGSGVIGTDVPTAKATSVQKAPPSVEAVRGYMADQGYRDDAVAFVDFYTANGWVQGRGKPIRDWQAAVRNWQRNGFASPVSAQPLTAKTFRQIQEENTTKAIEEFANG